MAGFENYIIIFVLALILFGPKKLPELARQLGKLMGEFRRASNEFKMQMEEELRSSERAEQEKKIAALEAAAPPRAALPEETPEITDEVPIETPATDAAEPAIATAGELTMRPPETGLPVAQTAAQETPAEPAPSPADAVNALADSIPAAHEGQTTHG